MELEKHFDYKTREKELYKAWEEGGHFNPDNQEGDPFTIIMPPPNANGSLHIGHALFVTIQDILTRYKRMAGFKSLWLPGADHAGFETQVVYAKKLEKEGRKFFDIPREDLFNEIKEFTLANKDHMEGQLHSLGASCDWSRKKFTLDEDIQDIVYETFNELYEDGLIYRGNRSINWCSRHQTSLSDLEITQPEVEDTLYYIQYGPFEIATARPETKFADKYVIVHPDDERYAKYKDGEEFEVDWMNGKIKATLIKDEMMDMEFGTGAMTITPWHSSVDFDLAKKHDLPIEQIIDWNGKLMDVAGDLKGEHIKKARPKIVELLKEKGLLIKEEKYTHAVPQCYKCKTPIEPQVRPQWFMAMTKPSKRIGKSLRDLAVEAVESGEVTFTTERFKNEFMRWMENLRDWNISRQIVWGIRIPAWEKDGEWKISKESPGEGWTQDEDVFDTWFSSGQWPFATLMTTKEGDFETFYPTDVMETGWDILFFWVARMVMFGMYKTGKAPFKTVYLNGLVRDQERKKMSKSKGNVIDPLGVATEYGTDAVRMALISGNAAGTDPVISEDKIRGYRNFTTKLWNMGKFILSQEEETEGKRDEEVKEELAKVKQEVTQYLEDYKLHLAAEALYHYTWHTVADVLIEESKEGKVGTKVLKEVFATCLAMLHPFMPYVTEELYGKLPGNEGKALIVEAWPR